MGVFYEVECCGNSFCLDFKKFDDKISKTYKGHYCRQIKYLLKSQSSFWHVPRKFEPKVYGVSWLESTTFGICFFVIICTLLNYFLVNK